MKIKLMSGYDVAQNYFKILENYQKMTSKTAKTTQAGLNTNVPVYKNFEQVVDTFVKETEKAAKK